MQPHHPLFPDAPFLQNADVRTTTLHAPTHPRTMQIHSKLSPSRAKYLRKNTFTLELVHRLHTCSFLRKILGVEPA